VYSTDAGSMSTLNGDDGDDVFNVRAMNGPVDVHGGAGDDTTNVTNLGPALPIGPETTPTGSIDSINALLKVDGGNGTLDTLNVDDSAAAAANNKTGTLTATSLTGLELETSIDYANLDRLNIWLGFGNNVFTINSTHGGATTVYTAKGNDTVYINGASGLLTVNGEEGNDTFDVRATGLGSVVHLNGQEGDDTFNLSDLSPALPAAYPATLPPPAATTIRQDRLDRRAGGDRWRTRTRARRRQRRRFREYRQQGRYADVDHAARARDGRRRGLRQC